MGTGQNVSRACRLPYLVLPIPCGLSSMSTTGGSSSSRTDMSPPSPTIHGPPLHTIRLQPAQRRATRMRYNSSNSLPARHHIILLTPPAALTTLSRPGRPPSGLHPLPITPTRSRNSPETRDRTKPFDYNQHSIGLCVCATTAATRFPPVILLYC